MRISATAELLGISRAALMKAVKDGRVKSFAKNEDGTKDFDVEECRRELAANSDPIKSASARMRGKPPEERHAVFAKPTPTVASEEVAEPDGQLAPGEISEHADLSELTRQKMLVDVRTKRQEYERRKGSLIEKDACIVAWSQFLTEAKSRLLAIGDSICARVASTTDAIACKEIIDERVYGALKALSEGDQFKWTRGTE